MATVLFNYEIKGKVKIKDLNVIGTVIGYYVGDTGKQYQVSYFLNGERKILYLYDTDITTVDSDTLLGFKT